MSATSASAPPAPAAAARPAPEAGPPSRWTLVILLAGIFVTTLDFFIVNVAIPDTQRDLGAGAAAVQWIVAGFGLAVASALIAGGRLGDMYGRRRLFAIGLALFTLASAACAMAPSTGTLIGARVAQGLSAALLMPQVLGIMNVVFTGAHRVRAFTAYGLAMGFAGVFGQLIGGLLIEADVMGLGWRLVYWINVPIGVAALALTRRYVPESVAGRGRGLDAAGTVLVTAALLAVMVPLVQGREQGWPGWVWASLAAAAALAGLFVAHQRRLDARGGGPLVPPALFRGRSFPVGITLATVYGMVNVGFFLVLALYLQVGQGMTALRSGLVFAVLGGGYFVSSARAGEIARRLGRKVLVVGSLAQGAGHALLAATVAAGGADGAVWWLVPGLLLTGFGMGVVMAPMASTVLADVRPAYAGAASGLLTTAQQVGGALGVAVTGVVFYGVLGSAPAEADFGPAFADALWLHAAVCAVVAGLVRLLPRPRPEARPEAGAAAGAAA